jgi:hypothetical protein
MFLGIAGRTRTVSSMVVMADEVVDVAVSHDAVHRRWPEQNARQQSDKPPAGTTPNARLGAIQVRSGSSGPRDGLK